MKKITHIKLKRAPVPSNRILIYAVLEDGTEFEIDSDAIKKWSTRWDSTLAESTYSLESMAEIELAIRCEFA